jgi:dTDP-4-amino-4,6-dideoxygalactose transaminase
MSADIPFNRPGLVGRELEYMQAAVRGGHSSASGPYTEKASEILSTAHDGAHVLLTTSCTDALEMSALLLDIRPGDLVIVPSFTFVSTALAFTRAGARILFADIEPVTLGIDPRHVAELLDAHPGVRAVVTVHYAGVAGEIEALQAVLAEHPEVVLIEDNAHGLFGAAGDRPLGTFGRMSTLSFHETKNFVCGEGGALVLNDPNDVDRAHTLHDKGTNRRAFFNGQVDKYTWVDTGSSFGMSDLLAAFLVGQLEQRDLVLARRRAVHDAYEAALGPVADELGLQLPALPANRTAAYHMYYLLLPTREIRDHVLDDLRTQRMFGTFHYVPLHSSDEGQRVAAAVTACPVTTDVSGRLLRLPYFNDLGISDVDRIAKAVIASLA